MIANEILLCHQKSAVILGNLTSCASQLLWKRRDLDVCIRKLIGKKSERIFFSGLLDFIESIDSIKQSREWTGHMLTVSRAFCMLLVFV
jgi:hypothetical protein